MSKPPRKMLACTLAAALLAACGGGDEDSAPAGGGGGGGGGGGSAVPLTCDTTKTVAGAVELPTAAQVTAYAGTYNGGEGTFDANGAFVKSADASVALGTDGKVSYKGTSYSITSACIDKASGVLGKVLYVIAGSGHLDISDRVDPDLGRAWGVSLANGTAIFRGGVKQ